MPIEISNMDDSMTISFDIKVKDDEVKKEEDEIFE
jgi:hypothetical protein